MGSNDREASGPYEYEWRRMAGQRHSDFAKHIRVYCERNPAKLVERPSATRIARWRLEPELSLQVSKHNGCGRATKLVGLRVQLLEFAPKLFGSFGSQ